MDREIETPSGQLASESKYGHSHSTGLVPVDLSTRFRREPSLDLSGQRRTGHTILGIHTYSHQMRTLNQ